MRRDGKSLGQMAREEIGKVGGLHRAADGAADHDHPAGGDRAGGGERAARAALGAPSPSPRPCRSRSSWGSTCATGGRARCWKSRSSVSCWWCWASSAGSGWRSPPALAPLFTFGPVALAVAVMVYGFLASALPVWLLLAPRDYLSTFVKLGVVLMLGVGILLRAAGTATARVHALHGRHAAPSLRARSFRSASSPSPAARSRGFHSLISSGTTPKMIAKEWHAWPVGLRLHAARKLRRHHGDDRRLRPAARRLLRREFARRALWAPRPRGGCTTITSWGFPVTVPQMQQLARRGGRDDAVPPYRRRAVAGAGHGAHLRAERRRHGHHRLLVSLRHHVRGAVHPHHHRCRHARGPLHAAGPAGARLEAAGPHQLDARRDSHQRRDRAGVGLLPATRACATRWAASTRCGRCLGSPTSCWPRWPCVWPPPS